MSGSYMILKSFDYKIGNNFKFSGSLLTPEDAKSREMNMNYEDIVLAVIIVKKLLVIYYIIVTNNCQ
jgi:hypothetical protein